MPIERRAPHTLLRKRTRHRASANVCARTPACHYRRPRHHDVSAKKDGCRHQQTPPPKALRERRVCAVKISRPTPPTLRAHSCAPVHQASSKTHRSTRLYCNRCCRKSRRRTTLCPQNSAQCSGRMMQDITILSLAKTTTQTLTSVRPPGPPCNSKENGIPIYNNNAGRA